MNLDIPALHPDRLYPHVPYEFFVWRTANLTKARGRVVAFFVDDWRFEGLWSKPERYTHAFLSHSLAALVEPDFSVWTNAPLIEQLWAVYRMRTLGRWWQDAGLPVIPNLTWSDERSFDFAFAGIPRNPPVVACECRTPSKTAGDRQRFLVGLREAVRRVQPDHIVVYGGTSHRAWLAPSLPLGPEYHLIDSWNTSRDKRRKAAHPPHSNQLQLFPLRRPTWAAEAVPAA